jgi:hypothetical protein
MDVLTVGGKSYVKASVLAQELGYTADYIGQLCRGEKVDAQLVGRSWYVERDSIQGHKSTRYRSTQVKTRKAIESHILVQNHERAHAVVIHGGTEATGHAIPVEAHTTARFYIHNSLKPPPRYSSDDADLLPSVLEDKKKTGHLQVDLADADTLTVVSKSEEYDFEIPSLPQIQFKGALSLSEYDDAEARVPEGGVLLHPKEVEQIQMHPKVHRPLLKEEQHDPVVSHSKHVKSTELEVVSSTEDTFIAVKEEQIQVVKSYLGMSIFISSVTACIVVALCLSLESRLVIVGDTLVRSYGLQFENLQASVYESVAYLKE